MLRRSLGAEESFDGKTASLAIPNVAAKHAGKYECVASNSGGEVRSSCVITVQGGISEI